MNLEAHLTLPPHPPPPKENTPDDRISNKKKEERKNKQKNVNLSQAQPLAAAADCASFTK